MDTTRASSIKNLSDRELIVRVTQLAAAERHATAVLIAHLAELDARQLYLGEGYSSLFTYCTEALHLSENAAYGRIQAARAARKFPILLEMLTEGSLTLTTLGLLAPHLTAENHHELLEHARHQSKRTVEELIVGLHPKAPVAAIVRRVPRTTPGTTQDCNRGAFAADPVFRSPMSLQACLPPVRPKVSPLAPQQYRIQFTASAETHDKLRKAQDLLRHQIPDGDLNQVLNRALTALLENLAREKFAVTPRPRPGQSNNLSSRHIPARVKRAVWLRDGARCAFISTKGRRCSATGFLNSIT